MVYTKNLEYMPCGMTGIYAKLMIRLLQIAFGITMFGIYLSDILAAKQYSPNTAINSAWVFATFVGGISAVSAFLVSLPCIASYLLAPLDWLLVIFHAGVIGVFGTAYLSGKKTTPASNTVQVTGPDFDREKSAAIVDCISGALWLVTAIMSSIIYILISRAKKAARY